MRREKDGDEDEERRGGRGKQEGEKRAGVKEGGRN